MSPVESPQAPSAMAASMRPRMVASSFALGGRRAKAHGGQPQGAVTDQLRDVEGESFVLVAAKEVLDRAPGEVHAGRNVEGEAPHILPELGGHGSGREPAIAHYLRGDTLADLGLRAPIAEEPPVGMRVHVDEDRKS